MSVTNFYAGGMNYSPCGRKRKNSTFKRKTKRTPVKFSEYIPTKAELDAHQARKAHYEKYPSFIPPTKADITREDTSWKLEESKNFTVAPAYNKGAYQVVPRNEVEFIGK